MGLSSLAGACMRQWQQVYSVWTDPNDAALAEPDLEADAMLSSPEVAVLVDVSGVAVAAGSASSIVSDSIALPSMNLFRCCAICSISCR